MGVEKVSKRATGSAARQSVLRGDRVSGSLNRANTLVSAAVPGRAPFAWGIVLAALARHIANAHQLQNEGADTDAFLQRLLEGFQAEIDNPTDEPEGEVTRWQPGARRVICVYSPERTPETALQRRTFGTSQT